MRVGVTVGIVTDVSVPGTFLLNPSVSRVGIAPIVSSRAVGTTVLKGTSVMSVGMNVGVVSGTVMRVGMNVGVVSGTVMRVGMNVGVVSGTVMSVGMNVGVVGTSGSPTVSSRRSGTTVLKGTTVSPGSIVSRRRWSGTTVLRGTTVSGAGIVGVVSNIVGSVGTTVGHVLVVSYPGSVSNVETPTFVLGLGPTTSGSPTVSSRTVGTSVVKGTTVSPRSIVSKRRSGTTVLRGTTVSGAGIVGVVSNIVGSVGTP